MVVGILHAWRGICADCSGGESYGKFTGVDECWWSFKWRLIQSHRNCLKCPLILECSRSTLFKYITIYIYIYLYIYIYNCIYIYIYNCMCVCVCVGGGNPCSEGLSSHVQFLVTVPNLQAGAHGILDPPCATKLRSWMGYQGWSPWRTCSWSWCFLIIQACWCIFG